MDLGRGGATISGVLMGGFSYDVAIFVGGESPVNYSRVRRRRAKDNTKRRRFGLKKEVEEGLSGAFGTDG